MVKFCTYCGTKLDDSDLFCSNCGKKSHFFPNSNSHSGGFADNIQQKADDYQTHLEKTGRKRAKIPRLGGIKEFREDSIIIKKTEEVIPIRHIKNFSLHQSQSLWSDVKVDFDYNGLHYRTQQAGQDKGKLQTIETKIKAMEMQKYSNNNANKGTESKIDKLKDLKELLDNGSVNEEEFNKLKDEIING